MPPAARITDVHICPAHGGGPVVTGFPTVIIGHQPAARISDVAVCAGPADAVAAGSASVIIGFQPAARMGDATSHGGVVATGFPTVLIGTTAQAATLSGASASGTPFCAECERARREAEARAQKAAEQEREAGPPEAAAEGTVAEDGGGEEAEAAAPADAPTEAETAQASAEGSTLEQRAAREKVVRDFYAGNGLGSARADVDLGVGGAPPRAGAHPAGFGIDLTKPVRVVPLPEALAQAVPAGGLPGNVFEPIGEGARGAGLTMFSVPAGVGLLSTSGPGAGRTPGRPQITVSDAVRSLALPKAGG